MDKTALTKAMRTSISEVLETMFFLPIEFQTPQESDDFLRNGDNLALATKLNFEGPFEGQFVLLTPAQLGRSLAASFLGKEESTTSEEEVTSTTAEILNMIAGNTFSIYDDQAVFSLGIPQASPLDPTEVSDRNVNGEMAVVIKTLDDYLAIKLITE